MTSYKTVRFDAGNVRQCYCLAFPFSAIIATLNKVKANTGRLPDIDRSRNDRSGKEKEIAFR